MSLLNKFKLKNSTLLIGAPLIILTVGSFVDTAQVNKAMAGPMSSGRVVVLMVVD